MLSLYSDKVSGNCYKIRLLLKHLSIPVNIIEIDVVNGACQTDEFKAINPAGKVPVIVFEDGNSLSESNAILLHFAEGSAYMPTEHFKRSELLQWLFWEQYSHEPAIAVARFSMKYLDNTPKEDPRLPNLWEKGYAALSVMENHLENKTFFVGEQYTIADIALFAYTHVAQEGGFDLSPYPHIQNWLTRVKSQPQFASMLEI